MYKSGFPPSERQAYGWQLGYSILQSLRLLASKCDELGVPMAATAALRAVQEAFDDPRMDAGLGRQMLALWRDPGIQLVYAQRTSQWGADQLPYFLDTRLSEVAHPVEARSVVACKPAPLWLSQITK